MHPNLAVVALPFLLAACAGGPVAPDTAPRARSVRDEDEGEGNPRGIVARWGHRLGADGMIPDGAFLRMKAERDRMLALQSVPGSSQVTAPVSPGLRNWEWLGPGNIGGRIRGFLVHPDDAQTRWIGSAGGGVWKTTNGGVSWEPLNDFLPTLAVGCMALDPADPDHLFVGTGEGGFFDTTFGVTNLAAPQGAGVFESTDGGTTWAQLASTSGPGWQAVSRLAIHPTNPSIILAGTSSGVFRTSDAGFSWTQATSNHVFDVDFHPSDGSLAVSGGEGDTLFSTDGGQTWQAAGGLPANYIRTELAYARSNPSFVYANVSPGNGRIVVYRSVDGGVTYTQRSPTNTLSTFSHYNSALWVDPTDEDFIVTGGINVYKSSNGGQTLQFAAGGIHPDQHVFVEHPNYNGVENRILFSGNDGGAYRTSNIKATNVSWQDINNNLGITQFYGAAIHPSTGVVYGGAQDNGTLLYNGGTNTWTQSVGADGGFCASDPSDPNVFYGEIQNLTIFRTSNGGASVSFINGGIFEPDPNFIPPFILDPNNTDRLLAAGARLWVSDNPKSAFPTWSAIKDEENCLGPTPARPRSSRRAARDAVDARPSHFALDPPCNISAIAVAPGDSEQIWIGHNNGWIFKTTNGTAPNPTWVRVDQNVTPARFVSRIAVDPRDSNRVYATFQGYASDNAWRTHDGGFTWLPITGLGPRALPSAPATSIAIHRTVPGWLYVGTDIGVFWSDDDGLSWTTSNEGPATTPVDELVWKTDEVLMAVTHGRGIYLADTFADFTPATKEPR